MQYQTNYPYATTSQQYGAISHLREEQRRRQQEYSLALAQQVAQREQQKRQERDMDQQYGRRYGNFHHPPQPQQGFGQTRKDNFESAERGMLDGLGRNNHPSSRTSFARGQQQQQQHLHQRLPGPEFQGFPPSIPQARASYGGQADFHPATQPSVGNQSVPSDFGLPGNSNPQQPMQQETWHQHTPSHADIGLGMPGPHVQTGWPEQNPQSNAMAQARNSQFWPGQGLAESGPQRALEQSFQPEYAQPEPSGNVHGGRRQRTDIHDGGRGDSEETERFRRKLQQQQEMQLALERQIEEKRQQKLEAKRRQEEEDRREMERFEEDQRRQRAEQECLQAEKRRKAALEQEKAEQAAAAVAAANQQAKLQQQQKFRAQAHQAQPQYHQPQHAQPSHLPPPLQQPEHFTNAPSPSRLRKNPFTNSRAHLFEDPPPQPSPQRGSMIPIDHYGHSNQNASPVRGVHQGFNPIYPQDSQPAFGRSLDPVELRRQYDDMREELHRQKQLVDQLRQAQQQQQQQLSPVRAGNGNIPTLMDLEKLRNELRGELEYREQLHRQELASLKREQQQERGPEHSPRHHPGVRNSIQPAPDKLQQIAPQPETNNYHAPPMWMASADNQRQQQHRRSPTKNLQTSHTGAPSQSEKPIGESLISLRGESEFVYFDGRMAGAGKAAKDHVGPGTKHESDGDSLDQHSKPVEVEESRALEVVRSSVRHSPTKKHSVEKSIAASASTTTLVGKSLLEDADSEDEAQGFVIQSSPIHKQLAPSPTTHARRLAASSHRYSQLPPALTSTSPSKKSGKWRLESMGTNDASDSDGDLDASLDGEQLEALFQRNVRRHEILLGFQTRVQAQTQESNQHEDDRLPQAKSAWTELHQKLENNRRTSVPEQRRKLSTASTSNDSTASQKVDAEDEAALVASSQWLLPIEQATKSSTKLTTLTRNK